MMLPRFGRRWVLIRAPVRKTPDFTGFSLRPSLNSEDATFNKLLSMSQSDVESAVDGILSGYETDPFAEMSTRFEVLDRACTTFDCEIPSFRLHHITSKQSMIDFMISEQKLYGAKLDKETINLPPNVNFQ